MLKNITLSADEALLKKARKMAASRNTTLNAEFRQWLASMVQRASTASSYQELMSRLSYAEAGGKFSREQLNER